MLIPILQRIPLLCLLFCVLDGLATLRAAPEDSNCATLPAATASPIPKATIRGEFLKDKTLIQDLYLNFGSGAEKTRAFVIKPQNAKSGGGAVLFVHLLGFPPDNDRTEFFEDAMRLADANVTSLLVDAPWSSPEWFTGRQLKDDLPNVLHYAGQLEAAMKFLLETAKPDPAKVAFVGHDFGAMYGTLLLKSQPAARHAVLMAAVPDFADWFVLGRKLGAAEMEAYRQQLIAIAPSRYLRCAATGNVLFQFAENDRFVNRTQAAAVVDSAPAKKDVKWYASGHELQEVSRADRVAWLKEQIGARQ